MLDSAYLWIKAFHIMAVIAWMAGLFYLPRLYVHHAERAKPESEMSDTFVMMEGKLLRQIMNPAMVTTWILGILLAFHIVDISDDIWFHIKFLLVVGMTVFHMWLARQRRAFAENRNVVSGRTYRIMNEVPTVLMVAIVLLVVIKPF